MVTLNIPEKFEISYCYQNSKIDLENKNRKDLWIKKGVPFLLSFSPGPNLAQVFLLSSLSAARAAN
jgi:hypothetical protein